MDFPFTPRQLAYQYERGRITREEFQKAMTHLQVSLLQEAAEVRKNPVTAYLNDRLSKRAIQKLLRNASEAEIREVLYALGDLPNFAPAQLLWNADQLDIPLHCFIRTKLEPVFRITYLNVTAMKIEITIEHGSAKKNLTTREDLILNRSATGFLTCNARHTRS